MLPLGHSGSTRVALTLVSASRCLQNSRAQAPVSMLVSAFFVTSLLFGTQPGGASAGRRY
jgi:hypothetical protein